MNQQPNNEQPNELTNETTNNAPNLPNPPFEPIEANSLPLSPANMDSERVVPFETAELVFAPPTSLPPPPPLPPPIEPRDFDFAVPPHEIPVSSENADNLSGEVSMEEETTAESIEVVPLETPTETRAPAPREKSNLAARVITALIGIPLVALLVWRADSAVFNGVVGFLAMLGLRELSKALRAAGTPLVSSVAYPALIALLLVQPITRAHPRLGGMIIWLLPFLLMVLLLISGVQRYPTDKRVSLQSLALTLFATLYVGLFVFLILLRSLRLSPFEDPPLGTLLMWLTVVAVWSGDIVAYFAGRKFGRDKLTPLSPGKTWEGAIAGLVATMVVSVSVAHQLQIELQHGLACGILISLAAPLGDLAESFWKRELQIKDTGGVLPGHGGILDRCDSLLFAAFAVYLYALIFIM